MVLNSFMRLLFHKPQIYLLANEDGSSRIKKVTSGESSNLDQEVSSLNYVSFCNFYYITQIIIDSKEKGHQCRSAKCRRTRNNISAKKLR